MNITLEQLRYILTHCDIIRHELDIAYWWDEGAYITIEWEADDGMNLLTIDGKNHIILCANVISGTDRQGIEFSIQALTMAPYIYVDNKSL